MYFLNRYRDDGVGLASFVEHENEQQYLKTRFETDFCHTIFPCFDQPDLMASLKLSCQTETDWTVITNDVVNEEADLAERAILGYECDRAASLFQDLACTIPAGKKQVLFR